MIKTLFREIAGFIRSRSGELGISEARYENLLGEADEYHREYLRHLLMYLVIR
jgi:intergrase/recombinase